MSNVLHAGGSGGRKIAIPRLPRVNNPPTTPKERRRVARACTACRAHKIKCSGDVPQCKHCESTGRECVYIMPRKDRLKIVTDRCAQMAGYLRTLRGWASEEDNIRIGELLDAVDEDAPEMPMGDHPVSVADTEGDDSRAASRISRFDESVVGSDEQVDINSLDLLDENLHENDRSRATGFVGKNSEVQWLRSLLHFEKAEDDTSKASGSTARRKASSGVSVYNEQVSVVTFYLDSEDVDSDFYIDPYELPTPETAERLLTVYMDKVHDSFPILPRRLFEDQFRKYFMGLKSGSAPRLNAKWQAILNLVFAIGARYSHLIKAEWRGNEKDHSVYQARARSFAWNETTLVQHPDLPQIQVAGMLAFYYLSVGQVSRAWIVAGMALRFAQALGLHVRNEDPSASHPKREVLVRIWWSLYYLERQLSVITGRPSVIVDSSCSVPLPLPVPESHILDDTSSRRASTVSALNDPPSTPTGLRKPDANSGSYIKAVVQMGIITQSILTGLYSAGTMIRSPAEIQQDIIQLGQRLDNWAATLPNEFNPLARSVKGKSAQDFVRERMLLGFQFYSGRILLTRPCIGGLGQAGKDRGDTTNTGFPRQMAMICLDAAKSQLDLLPDEPDPLFLLENGPWWSIVHHFMQALAVILLALSHSTFDHHENNVLSDYAKKSIRWLRSLDDPLASRASQVAFNSFEMVANRLSLDVSDLWSEYAPVFPRMASSDLHHGMETTTYPIPSSSGIFNPGANLFDPALGMSMSNASHPLFHLDATEENPVYGSAHGGPEYENFHSYRPPH